MTILTLLSADGVHVNVAAEARSGTALRETLVQLQRYAGTRHSAQLYREGYWPAAQAPAPVEAYVYPEFQSAAPGHARAPGRPLLRLIQGGRPS